MKGCGMRKLLMLLVVGLLPVLASPSVAATAKPTEQELLLIKKKKAEAARKVADAKKRTTAKALAGAKPRVVAVQKPAKARPIAVERRVAGRSCARLLQCLFGNKPRAGVQRASTGGAARAASDYATAENISWAPGSKYAPGSIVVQTPERALYYVLGDGKARRYKVGVGREGFQWSGNSRIVNKAEWPTWRPPQVMIEREAAKGHFLPEEMEGGPENPLGARAMYIGGTMYRIHGTNNAGSIGGAVSSGCIRMMNTDVVDLYDRVKVGAKVYVYQ
jgi:lipoprotein-anchoring transpeptidase ErfK/SrfK